jgi:uncharacterized protein
MKPDIFFLPYNDEYILHVPLRKFIAVVNKDAMKAVSRWLEGTPLHEAESGLITELEKRGVLDENIQQPQVDECFAPTRVTLFPSDSCNLRCRYCYASAGDGQNTLSIPAARAAIDFIAENAAEQKHKQFNVGFHGNGEPFTAFDVVRECCEYTNAVADKNDLKYSISTATNGFISEKHLDYLLAWVTDFNISSDILPDIQNSQRPTAEGQGSFDIVDGSIRRLDKAGIQYGIRATITKSTVARLREMAAYVKEFYPNCGVLHFEPVFQVGRALETLSTAPDPKVFVQEYIKAQDELAGSGIRLVYSGERANTLCQCFCSACSNGFTVTAEGNVTSCYEICTYRDTRAKRYIYGRFEQEANKFIFDEEVMQKLLELQVKNIPFCEDCFCKWHCGGDCVAKTIGEKPLSGHSGSDRCVINRALTYRQLLLKIGIDPPSPKSLFF